MNKQAGLDYYELNATYYQFLDAVVSNHWQIYDLKVKQHLFFYASVYDRNAIIKVYPSIQLHKTIGLLGVLFRFIKQKERVIAIILSCCCWFLLSSMIFEIQIHVDHLEHKELIQQILLQNGYHIPFHVNQKTDMTIELFEKLKQDISWLEIKQQGSKMMIHALGRIEYEQPLRNSINLYAKKDGVIRFFDLKSGHKNVSLDQLVHKGDLLISNQMVSSNQQIKEIFVEGKVYATTVERKIIELEDEGHDALTYFKGILLLRNEITKYFSSEESIIKEIPLQFIKKEGKIVLEVIFICNEQIAMLGE